MNDLQIIPAILTNDISIAKKQFGLVAGLVNRVQFDVVDGEFVDNKTVGIEALEQINSSLIVDAHLMVVEPISYVGRCESAGVERVYAQVERMSNQEGFIDRVTASGMAVGLALDIYTPVSAITKVLPHLDGVILMAIEVGFQGRKFDERVLKKIEELRKQFERDICIDGSMNVETIPLCLEQGANHFAVGSTLWGAKDIKAKLEELQRIGLN